MLRQAAAEESKFAQRVSGEMVGSTWVSLPRKIQGLGAR